MTTGPTVFHTGTSGFSYDEWRPAFYPDDLKKDAMLSFYAAQLPAVELNNTFYQQPTPPKIASWLAATPDELARRALAIAESGVEAAAHLEERREQRADGLEQEAIALDERLGHAGILEMDGAGDAIIVSGPVGDHGIAVMLAREQFGLRGDLRGRQG